MGRRAGALFVGSAWQWVERTNASVGAASGLATSCRQCDRQVPDSFTHLTSRVGNGDTLV
jgi:hypothetical protein